MACYTLKYIAKSDITVPCGRCAFCAIQKRSDWALRLHYEARKHIGSKFITLTYANPHLKWKNGTSQLVKSDLQKFFKRVRKAGQAMRYYAVGEYGSKTFRPHYHVIMFGDINEEIVRKSWPFGQVHIGFVTMASVMYCLGYVCNARGKGMNWNRERPFTLMSRRPGLGANYLTKSMVAWHKSDRKNYAILDGVKRHLPRYYKCKIFSKIDLVRIAVREAKEAFRKEVEWIRSKPYVKMRDPIAYRDEQRRIASIRIKKSFKDNLII